MSPSSPEHGCTRLWPLHPASSPLFGAQAGDFPCSPLRSGPARLSWGSLPPELSELQAVLLFALAAQQEQLLSPQPQAGNKQGSSSQTSPALQYSTEPFPNPLTPQEVSHPGQGVCTMAALILYRTMARPSGLKCWMSLLDMDIAECLRTACENSTGFPMKTEFTKNLLSLKHSRQEYGIIQRGNIATNQTKDTGFNPAHAINTQWDFREII